jgi:GAF domain-containing protein
MRTLFNKKLKTPVRSLSLSSPSSDLFSIRNIILNRVFVSALIFGGIALVFSWTGQESQGINIPEPVYLLFFAWLIFITFVRQLSYSFRAMNFLLLILSLSLTVFLDEGHSGYAWLFLIALPYFASVLLGYRLGFVFLILSWMMVILIEYYHTPSALGVLLRIDASNLRPATPSSSIALTSFIIVSGIIFVAQSSLLRGLEDFLHIERKLRADLEVEHHHLERQVQVRTKDFERRLNQFQITNEIIRKIRSFTDPEELSSNITEFIQQKFNLDYVGLFEVDESGSHLVCLSESKSNGGNSEESNQLTIDNDSSVGRCVVSGKAQITLDVEREWRVLDHSVRPIARSEMVIPLLSSSFGERKSLHQGDISEPLTACKGALALFSDQPMAFNSDDINLFQDIADNLVYSIELSQRIRKIQSRIDDAAALNRQSVRDSWSRIKEKLGILTYIDQTPGSLNVDIEKMTYQIPIVLRGQVIGLLALENNVKTGAKESLSSEERAFVEAVLVEAALALENARLITETQKRVTNEQFLSEISQKVHSSSEIDSILRIAVKEIGQGLGAAEALIRLSVPHLDKASQQSSNDQ